MKRILISIVAIFIAFSVFEIYLRFYPLAPYEAEQAMSQSVTTIYQLDPVLLFKHKKNTSHSWSSSEFTENRTINSLGMRDDEVPETKSGNFRIIMAGDSFTFGHGIPENNLTYPNLVEQLLKKKGFKKGKVEVFNAGVAGYTPDLEYRYISGNLFALNPDLLVWNLTLPNDIFDLTLDNRWPFPALYAVKDNKLVYLDARLNWFYIRNFLKTRFPLLGNSRVINTFFHLISPLPVFNGKPDLPENELLAWGVKKLLLELDQISQLAKQNKTEFMVVLLPTKETTGILNYSGQIREKILEIKKNLIDLQINSIDPSDKLNIEEKSGAVSAKDLFYNKDIHPNVKGAEYNADIITEYISELIKE